MSTSLVRILLIENHLEDARRFRDLASEISGHRLQISYSRDIDHGLRSAAKIRPHILLVAVAACANGDIKRLRQLRLARPQMSIIALAGTADNMALAQSEGRFDDCVLKRDLDTPLISRLIRFASLNSPLLVELREMRAKLDRCEAHCRKLRSRDDNGDTDTGRDESAAQPSAIIAKAQQAQKMEALGQLTGGLAHDFNNLLAVIVGNLQLIQRSLMDDAGLARQADAALDAALRGAKLTRQLLAVARRQPLEPQAINIGEHLSSFAEILYRTLGGAVKVSISIAPDLCCAMADPSLLESAVLNLVINARDAMPDGGNLSITVSNFAVDDSNASQFSEFAPGDYVSLAIADDGAGMSATLLSRVVEPFYTTKINGSGTGLGLSMVHGFAKQSGGQLELMSKEGAGTTATIYLPRATDAEVAHGEATMTRIRAIPKGTETILVVEDDDTVREVARSMLKALGYTIFEAADAETGLTVLRERENVDLLFTDVVMQGGMNGAELARHVVRAYPGMKILYTSGYTAMFDADKQPVALSPLLSKPYQMNELAAKVREVLDADSLTDAEN